MKNLNDLQRENQRLRAKLALSQKGLRGESLQDAMTLLGDGIETTEDGTEITAIKGYSGKTYTWGDFQQAAAEGAEGRALQHIIGTAGQPQAAQQGPVVSINLADIGKLSEADLARVRRGELRVVEPNEDQPIGA